MGNDIAPDQNDTAGPVAGEALKSSARWPGYGVIAIGLAAMAMSLVGFAVGRTSWATVAAVIAVLAIGGGVLWQIAQHRPRQPAWRRYP